jgi:peptidoglycan/xylan/chitin deacetylase (PgdA/CDA1 family)
LPVIPLNRLVDHLDKGTPLPDHSVVITIDDGYKTARTKAWPILKAFGFPVTLYIYTQFVGHKSALSWEDIEALSREGVDIESHSVTHPLLTHPQKAMTRKEYIAWIDHELVDSKKELEAHIGKPVTTLAYPFGGYDERIVERTKKAGYLAALTCDDGNVTRNTDPWHLNRRLVYHHVKPREFAEYFPDHTLQVADLYPRDGERIRQPLSEVRARVLNVNQILPGSVRVFIDKLGRHALAVKVDPRTGQFEIPLPPEPKKGYYFVSLFARDRTDPSLRREASWLFIISGNPSKR